MTPVELTLNGLLIAVQCVAIAVCVGVGLWWGSRALSCAGRLWQVAAGRRAARRQRALRRHPARRWVNAEAQARHEQVSP